MKKLLLFFIFSISVSSIAQDPVKMNEIDINPIIRGTLFSPEKENNRYLVILIAGSGPTDRNGNQPGMQNNSLKFLAESLAKNDISVFSYDKRMFALIAQGTLKEETLSFDDFINDARDVINHFKSKKQYKKIIVAGHSEGSLIGMIAAQNTADAYISLAGAGRTIDQVLAEQIEKQAPELAKESKEKLGFLKSGLTFKLENPMLASIFRESVQPYLISWIKYDPQQEIKKLKIPVQIINGTKDLQVKTSEAELLKKARPKAKLHIIENMNHIFKGVKGTEADNMASYSDPNLPIMTELTTVVNQFIKSL